MALITKAGKLFTRALGSNKTRTEKGKKALAEDRIARRALSAGRNVAKNRQDAGGAVAARKQAIKGAEKKLKEMNVRYEKNPTPKLKEDIKLMGNRIGNMKDAQQGKPDQFGKGGLKDIKVDGNAGSLPKDKAKLEHQGAIRAAGDKAGVKFLKKQPVKVDPKAPKETLPPMKRQLTLASFNKFLKKKGLPPVKSLPKIGNRVKRIKKKTGGIIKREHGGKIQMAKASWMDGLTKKQIDEILGRPTRDSSGVKKSGIKKKSKPIKVKPAKAGGALKPKKSAYKTGGVVKRNTGGRIAPSKGWGKARIK